VLEKDLNSGIVRSLSWGFKIPDPPGIVATKATKRPFDLFGILAFHNEYKIVFIESKYSKTLSSFNLKRIETHQAENLTKLSDSNISNVLCLIAYGCHVARGDTRLFLFDWKALKSRYECQHNILKKELETLPYNSMKKGVFDIQNIIFNF
jgi:hypothetical protein